MKIIKENNQFVLKTSKWEWDKIGIQNQWMTDNKISRYFPNLNNKPHTFKLRAKSIALQIKNSQSEKNIGININPSSLKNPLDGKSNEQARKIVRRIISEPSRGLFSDNSWKGPQRVFNAMDQADLSWNLTDTQYGVSKTFQETWPGEKWKIPNNYKEWKFEISFVNNRGKLTKLYGVLTAHGAGTVNDPLEKYDLTVVID